MGYVGSKNGLSTELFKLAGTLLAAYLSLHYYTAFAAGLVRNIGLEETSLRVVNFVCFVLLAIAGYFVFIILRKIFLRFVRLEPTATLEKWGGFIIGIVRSSLIISLLLFIFLLSSVGYLKQSVNDSYSGKGMVAISTNTYTWLWDSLISKFMTREKFNHEVISVQENSLR